MHKVCYKSYLFLEVKLITLAGGSTFMGLQGRALHPYSLSGDSLTPALPSLAECSSDIPWNKTKMLKLSLFYISYRRTIRGAS